MSNFMTNPDDLIWRGDALKAITGEPNDLHYPGWYIDAINGVPGVEQKVVIRMEATAKDLTFIPNEPNWIPVSDNDGRFIHELSDYGRKPFLITYETGIRRRRFVTVAWFENGRADSKRFNRIIAYMPSPEPYSK